MGPRDGSLLRQRLINHKLAWTEYRNPADVVAWFGAVQAQDYAGGKWALALRAQGLTDAVVERAFNDGSFLRTHVLRPTWHFVAPADLRWLLALTGPRVIASMRSRHRQLELDGATVSRSHRALTRALEGGRSLTRHELGDVLRRARLHVTPERLAHLVMHAELDRLVCSGPLRGRQFTYALLDERVPPAAPVERDEALARLAERYFASHGPATVADFSWWSGLTLREARRGVEAAGAALRPEIISGVAYFCALAQPRPPRRSSSTWLLPNYDEYLVAYRNRAAVLGTGRVNPRDELTQTVIVDGVAVGAWRRAVNKGSVAIEVAPRHRLTRGIMATIERAAARYGDFLGTRVSVKRSAERVPRSVTPRPVRPPRRAATG